MRLVRGARSAPTPSVVHAHDVETLAAGWLLARGRRARLVYDAHELYGDEEPDPPRLYRFVVRRIERLLAPRADAVVTVGAPIAEELQRTLRLRELPGVVLSAPPVAQLERAPRGDGPLLAVYQGAAGPGRRVADLLDAMPHAGDTHLTIRVVNVDRDALRREVASRGLSDRVDIAPPVAPEQVCEALLGFHVGLVINRPVTRNDELVLPNKLFEYLMAGLAVVVPRLPGLAPLVESEEVGLVFEPGDVDGLGRALARLAGDPGLLDSLRERGHRAARERFNAESQREVLERAWHG
jgi:glycosyltransferase involved in cell wall biosynthesis